MRATTRDRTVLCLALAALAAGCAPKRPVLYPNSQLRHAGMAAAQEDVDYCVASAREFGVSGSSAARAAGNAGESGATGAAVGAAAGAVRGHAGLGAATGAAGAAAGGLVRGLFRWRDPDPIEARFVQQCLGDLGYQVIGWK